MEIEVAPKYKMNGAINGFEAYMLATTDRQKAKHKLLEGCGDYIDNDGQVHRFEMSSDDERSEALTSFNRIAAKHFDIKGGIPSGNQMGLTVIYLIPEFGDTGDDLLTEYNRIINVLKEWYQETGINWIVASHFHQYVHGDDNHIQYPHVHLLWTRRPRKLDEGQQYLMSHHADLGCSVKFVE